MKTIVIAGRAGKDAELRRTQEGKAVLGFSVAVDHGYGDRKRTIWFDVSLWGKRGQSLESHIKKGTQVTVSGDFATREHDGKTYLTVDAWDVDFSNPRQSDTRQSSGYGEGQSGYEPDGDDDPLPF